MINEFCNGRIVIIRTFHQISSMKKMLFIVLILLSTSIIYSQTRFAKYPIEKSGASIYLPGEPTWELTFSEDSSEVYTGNVGIDTVNYSAIVIKFKEKFEDKNGEELQDLLTSYIDFIGSSVLELVEIVPVGYGHTLESNTSAIGAITYGVDADGYNYAIKGWIDNEFLAILMVISETEANFTMQELFLNGFRFPEK